MKYKTEIGTIGHIDHGKTTLSAAIISANQETKHESQKVVVVEENKGIDSAPAPFIIKNYHADYQVSQQNYLTGKQMRNQRRKQNRNRK